MRTVRRVKYKKLPTRIANEFRKQYDVEMFNMRATYRSTYTDTVAKDVLFHYGIFDIKTGKLYYNDKEVTLRVSKKFVTNNSVNKDFPCRCCLVEDSKHQVFLFQLQCDPHVYVESLNTKKAIQPQTTKKQPLSVEELLVPLHRRLETVKGVVEQQEQDMTESQYDEVLSLQLAIGRLENRKVDKEITKDSQSDGGDSVDISQRGVLKRAVEERRLLKKSGSSSSPVDIPSHVDIPSSPTVSTSGEGVATRSTRSKTQK